MSRVIIGIEMPNLGVRTLRLRAIRGELEADGIDTRRPFFHLLLSAENKTQTFAAESMKIPKKQSSGPESLSPHTDPLSFQFYLITLH